MVGWCFVRQRQTFGVRARPRAAFCTRRSIESDAKTHRTPKALRAKCMETLQRSKVERVVLNALSKNTRLGRLISCAFGD